MQEIINDLQILTKAINDIKKHQESVASQEFMGEPMYKKSILWNIASNALERIESDHNRLLD